MMQGYRGFSEKIRYLDSANSEQPLQCYWPIGGERLPISRLLGSTLRLELSGVIHCGHCGQPTKRSYSQGYCYSCFKRLARCDLCMMAPTRCHFEEGTCREPSWAEDFCFAPHVVYLANSSDLKVGITRPGQEFTRWTDQGAEQGLVLLHTDTRQLAGAMEATIGQWVSDRSNWRKLISKRAEPIDLLDQAQQLLGRISKLPSGVVAAVSSPRQLVYPVQSYAEPKSLKLQPGVTLEAELLGIRGQYLLFKQGALNVRNLTSMELVVTTDKAEASVEATKDTAQDAVNDGVDYGLDDEADDESQMELFS